MFFRTLFQDTYHTYRLLSRTHNRKTSQSTNKIPTPNAKMVPIAAPLMPRSLALPVNNSRPGDAAPVPDAVGTGIVVLAKPTPLGPKLTV